MIIGIAGKKGSGKDTVGKYLINHHGFTRYAFGDPVKEVCRLLFGFTDEQLYGDKKEELTEFGIKPREAFQKIGTDFGRNILHTLLPDLRMKDGELWIDIFRRECPTNKLIVVTDVRFQNEADAIKEKGAKKVFAVCTHGIFSGKAIDNLDNSALEKIYVSDSIPLSEDKLKCEKIEVLSVSKLFADAINSIHEETSVSKLFI